MAAKKFTRKDLTSDKFMQPCIVVWEDAESMGMNESITRATIMRESKPCIRRTIGYYVGYKETRLHLCIDDDGKPDQEVDKYEVCGANQIPLGIINEIIWLNPAPRRRRRRK